MSKHTPQILVVDDDPEIRKLLARYLEGQSLRVLLAATCGELRERLVTHKIDLIVLDVMLPDGSGLEMCRSLRGERSTVPIILLTALKEDDDRIIGLEIGADDYLGKPFNPRELVARIRAVLRRQGEPQPQSPTSKLYRFENFAVDPALRQVASPGGSEVDLTGAEFDLLQVFLERPGRVLSRDGRSPRRRRSRCPDLPEGKPQGSISAQVEEPYGHSLPAGHRRVDLRAGGGAWSKTRA